MKENLRSSEDIVSLSNGCVCCSLRRDIVKAIRELEEKQKKTAVKYDGIILETTGLADPAPIAFTFFNNPWIAARYKLDSILCIVDANSILRHLDEL